MDLLTQIWPYLAAALVALAGVVGVRQAGKAAGKHEERRKQERLAEKVREKAREAERENDAKTDDAIRADAGRWVRHDK